FFRHAGVLRRFYTVSVLGLRGRAVTAKKRARKAARLTVRSTMDDHRTDTSVDRKEFLRRTGALGIAGATALGFPLLETRIAGAAPLLPARDVIAAGGGATIKIGHIDGFSGVYAAASQSQQHGLEVAVAEAMKKNNRIKYEIVKGDDASKPATGTTERSEAH